MWTKSNLQIWFGNTLCSHSVLQMFPHTDFNDQCRARHPEFSETFLTQQKFQCAFSAVQLFCDGDDLFSFKTRAVQSLVTD